MPRTAKRSDDERPSNAFTERIAALNLRWQQGSDLLDDEVRRLSVADADVAAGLDLVGYFEGERY